MIENLKCLECQCVGSLKNTTEGVVLFPEHVLRTVKDPEKYSYNVIKNRAIKVIKDHGILQLKKEKKSRNVFKGFDSLLFHKLNKAKIPG